jgi:YfiH family protein
MITDNVGDRIYFRSELLGKNGRTVHFFTSKPGGCSHGKISGLNLGFRVGDNPESVRQNYFQIAEDFDIPFENMVAAKQIHSSDIHIVTDKERGFGVSLLDKTFEADGLVTDCADVPIAVFFADCVPILLEEESKGVVAAVHSGWRGTVSRIAEKTVRVMTEDFGADAGKIKAAIGPAIGKCCFETGEEVACKFDTDIVNCLPGNKFKVDLWEANRRILTSSGVRAENIDVFKLCTMCNSDMLYSYRSDGENTGRMAAVIMLRK